MTNSPQPTKTRRNFLYGATVAVGAAGFGAAAWPLIDQMNPDAGTRAKGDFVDVYLDRLRAAEQRVERWRQLPISIVRRTPEMLKAMQEPTFVATLIDPRSEKRQQPDYTKNWHRSIDPAYAVLVGVCTRCRCIPRFVAGDASTLGPVGAYFCPCCASRYDPAGRAYSGPAQYNLAVPPHDIVDRTRIVIGKNPPGALFTFEALEQA